MSTDDTQAPDKTIYTLFFDRDGNGPAPLRIDLRTFPAIDGKARAALGMQFHASDITLMGERSPQGGGLYFSSRESVELLFAAIGEWIEAQNGTPVRQSTTADHYMQARELRRENQMLRSELAAQYPIALTARAFMNDEATEADLREISDTIGNSTEAARLEYLPTKFRGV